MKTRSKSYRLVRRAGQQGTRPQGRNQPGIEKCATGINSSEDDENSLLTAKETLKQKIQVKAQRLRRYDKRNRFYRQNKIFKIDAKTFYREFGKRTINIEEPPVDEEMTKFWNDIWGKEKDFNNEAEWIRREEERMHLQSHINGNLLE